MTLTPALSPSAYVDTFARDHLPPADLWPTLEFTTECTALPRPAQRSDRTHRRPGRRRTARTASPCVRRVVKRGPTASCSDAPIRWPKCSSRTSAWSPATACCCAPPTIRGPSPPGSASSRPAGIAVTTFSALRARELTPVVEKSQTGHRAGRPPLRRRHRDAPQHHRPRPEDRGLRRHRRRRSRRPVRRPSPATSPTSRPPPTTWPCSGRPPEAPARPRSPRTSIATSCRSTTPSGRTSWRSRTTTSSPAPRRSPSPSASGCWWCSRCGLAPRRC